MSVIYLAGPIAGCSWDESIDWRTYVRQCLLVSEAELDIRSPLRGKEFLEGSSVLPLTAGEIDPIASQHAIVIRDHHDVTQADVIIANLLPSAEVESASIGTAFELAWAYHLHIPVIVVMEEPNPNWHPFVLEAAYIVVSTLEDAVKAAANVLNIPVI